MLSEGIVLTRARFIALMLLVGWASPALPQDAFRTKNVLALYWYGRDYPTNVLYEQGLVRALRETEDGPEYYSEYLESRSFPRGRADDTAA